MAITLIDEFIRGGSESSPWTLTSHTPVAGGTWTGSTANVINPDGFVRANASGAGVAITMYTTATGSADYEIGGIVKVVEGTLANNRTNFILRALSSSPGTGGGASGVLVGIFHAFGSFRATLQDNVSYSGLNSQPFTPVAGRSYFVVASASGSTVAVAVRDEVTGLWLDGTGTFASATRVDAASATTTHTTGQYFGIQSLFSNDPATNGTHVDSLYRASVSELPPTALMSASPSSIPANHAGNITITLTGTATSWAAQTFTVSGVTGVTKVSQNITSSTAATLVVTTGSSTGTLTISDGTLSTTITVGTPSFTISPTSGNTGTTPTVTFTGTNTVWSQETAAGLFTLSGGTGASIGTPTVTTNTAATATLTAGTAAGTLTLTDTAVTGSTASFTVAAPPITVPVTSSSIVWSPGNWYSDGAGAMGSNNVKGSSTFAQTNNVGAYFRHRFTMTSIGDVKLNLDTSMLSAVTTSGDRPILSVSLDGKAISTVQLTTVASSTQVTLASSVAVGEHTINVWWSSTNFGASYDRWNTPGVSVKITGIELPADATTAATPATRTYKMLVFGDSITEGASIVNGGSGISTGDATLVYGAIVGRALDAEVGIVGFSGQGWSGVGSGNVPVFSTAYASYWSGASRDWSDIDYIIINHGQNGSFTSNTVGTTVSAIASACPAAAIYVIPTLSRTAASTILAATLPASAQFLDLGVIPELKGDGFGLWDSSAPHPNQRGHAAVAALIATGIKATELAQAPTFGTFGAGRL